MKTPNEVLPWLEAAAFGGYEDVLKMVRTTVLNDTTLWPRYAQHIQDQFSQQLLTSMAHKTYNDPSLLDTLPADLQMTLFKSLRTEHIQHELSPLFHWVQALKPSTLKELNPKKDWDAQRKVTEPIERIMNDLLKKLQKTQQELVLREQKNQLEPATQIFMDWIKETPTLLHIVSLDALYKISPNHKHLFQLEPFYLDKKELFEEFSQTVHKNKDFNQDDANLFIHKLAAYYHQDKSQFKAFTPALNAAEQGQFELADAWNATGVPFDPPHKIMGSTALSRTLRKTIEDIAVYYPKYQHLMQPKKELSYEDWANIWNTRGKMEQRASMGKYARFLESQGCGTPPAEWLTMSASRHQASWMQDLLQTKLPITATDANGNTLWHIIMNTSTNPKQNANTKHLYTYNIEYSNFSSPQNTKAAQDIINLLIQEGPEFFQQANNAGQLPITISATNRFKASKTNFPMTPAQLGQTLALVTEPSLTGNTLKMETVSQAVYLKKQLKPEDFAQMENHWLKLKTKDVLQNSTKTIPHAL